jgi:quinoprotein glucose dehydrogenase
MAADLELGYVCLPIEMPTCDYYDGHRPGDNLFGDSLVCLNAKTGERIWHFQTVHHDIWDWDLASQPVLLDVTVPGSTRVDTPFGLPLVKRPWGRVTAIDMHTGDHR